ncbi:MAG: sigma-70 family RNA polymerase sigma factor [Acidobacteriota bacterium]
MTVSPHQSPDSLEELLGEIQPQLQRVLSRFSLPPAKAEEILQDVFLTFIYKRDRIESPRKWILRTLRRQCVSYWRERRRQLYSNLDAALFRALASVEDQPRARKSFHLQLDEVLDELPLRCRDLFRRRYGLASEDGLPPQETVLFPLAEDLDPITAAPGPVERCFAALGRRLVESGLLYDETSSAAPN